MLKILLSKIFSLKIFSSLTYSNLLLGNWFSTLSQQDIFQLKWFKSLRQLLLGAIALLLLTSCRLVASAALEKAELIVYRTPTCGCCEAWKEQMQAQGFAIQDHVTEAIDSIKAQQGLPQPLESCHTALINGYAIEGHVPAEDLQKLLAERPAIAGLAVPGMPVGAPGMESGNTVESYNTVAFDRAGHMTVFAQHGA